MIAMTRTQETVRNLLVRRRALGTATLLLWAKWSSSLFAAVRWRTWPSINTILDWIPMTSYRTSWVFVIRWGSDLQSSLVSRYRSKRCCSCSDRSICVGDTSKHILQATPVERGCVSYNICKIGPAAFLRVLRINRDWAPVNSVREIGIRTFTIVGHWQRLWSLPGYAKSVKRHSIVAKPWTKCTYLIWSRNHWTWCIWWLQLYVKFKSPPLVTTISIGMLADCKSMFSLKMPKNIIRIEGNASQNIFIAKCCPCIQHRGWWAII